MSEEVAMAQRIEVDPPALFELAGRLSTVKAELEKAQCVFNDDGSIHSAKIDGALETFCGAWSDKRSELVIHLQGAGDFLKSCAEQFLARDKELKDALGAPPSGGESNGQPVDSSGNGASGTRAGQGGRPVGAAGPVPVAPPIPPASQADSHDAVPLGAAVVAPTINPGRPSGSQPPVQSTPGVPVQPTPVVPSPPDGSGYDFADGPRNRPTERGFRSGRPEDFAAWSVNEMLQDQEADWTFDNFMTTDAAGNEAGYGKWGPAHGWLDRAEQLGFDHDDTPRAGAVAFWGKEFGGGEGNVAIVKEVNENGSITLESLSRRSGEPTLRTLRTGNRRWPEAFIHVVPGS